jgi:hypothetical protein
MRRINMLKEIIQNYNLKAILLPRETFKPFPTYSNREDWVNIEVELRDSCIKSAEQYLNYDWPPSKPT